MVKFALNCEGHIQNWLLSFLFQRPLRASSLELLPFVISVQPVLWLSLRWFVRYVVSARLVLWLLWFWLSLLAVLARLVLYLLRH